MRCIYYNVVRDDDGDIINDATITVYLAGSTTLASIYTSLAGTTSTNSVTSNSKGEFTFYVSRFDYCSDQKFKYTVAKTGMTTKTYDDVTIDRVVMGTYAGDKTLTTNIHVPKGVVYSGTITVSTGKITAGPYQIFTGTGTVSGLEYSYPEWFGTDHDAFDSAIAASSSVELTASSYTITDTITAAHACKIFSNNKSEIIQSTAAKAGINITASNVTIKGIKLTGTQYTVSTEAEKAIYAYGADKDNYITDIHIEDCEISTWGFAGIWTSFISDFTFKRNKISNIYYAGIATLSSIKFDVSGNNVNNVVGTPNAYGIAFSRTEDDSITTYPRSGYGTCSNNIVRNVPNWSAYDTHGGEHITFENNVGYGSKLGMVIGSSNNGSSVETFAPLNVNAIGNILNSGVTDGTYGYGLVHHGASGVQQGTGSLVGNTVDGYGDESSLTGCAVYTYSTDGLMIANNAILRAGRTGYYSGGADVGTIFTGNTVFDVWSNTSVAIGVRVVGDGSQTSTLAIHGNYFANGSKSATYTYSDDGFAVYVDNTAHLDVQVGKNYIYGVTYSLYDVGNKAAKISNGGQTTSGTGEDTLGTITIPAATIGIGGGMRIYASGTKTGANDTKTIKFYIGATAITIFPATNDQLDWQFEATIFNTATNAQIVTWNLKSTNDSSGAATVYGGYDATAIDTTADVIIKFTGECANAGDAVTQKMFFIDRV